MTKMLTRPEELILLAIWQLKENAYCVPIREHISRLTGDNWSLGSIYMPLDRLGKRGYLDSYLSEATPQRGGRHKRIYTLTRHGSEALIRVRNLHEAIWAETEDINPESF
ncbi:PadR family transcriptional regulator [bacterium]|nr:PadR family transcriptional regulator [bacterium]